MINRAIYTWMGDSFVDGNLLQLAKMSVRESLLNYIDVVCYCDNPDLFEGFGFTEIIKVDYNGFNLGYDNIPKLISYSMQNEPFIHIDFDCIVFDKIFTNLDIVCEKIRMYNDLEIPNLPSMWDGIKSKQYKGVLCSGIFGGNNTDLFKNLLDEALKYHDPNKENVSLGNKMVIEELLATKLIIEDNLDVFDCTHQGISYKHIAGRRAKQEYQKKQ
jgi:hypothetical protein